MAKVYVKLREIVAMLLRMRFTNIFRLIKSCQTTIQRLTFFINAIAENFAGPGVFARGTLISAFSLFVAGYDLI